MDESLRQQRDTALRELDALIQRGCQIRAVGSVDATRAWQRDCAAAINQLSGGSKAHWLSRAYSEAFLVRSANGGVVVEAEAGEIVDRILDVLAQGAASLSGMDAVAAASTGAPPRPRRFEFVRNAQLRPVLERAFDASRDAFDRGEFALALVLSCSVIESLLTDGLDVVANTTDDRRGGPSASTLSHRSRRDESVLAGGTASRSLPADRRSAERDGLSRPSSFEQRIARAEAAGIIRGGCARLPAVARAYHDLTDEAGELRAGVHVTEREARLAGQVLRVVMRDLDPGR
jgi:hypothetical protein